MLAARSSSSEAHHNTSVCEGVIIAAKFDLLWVACDASPSNFWLSRDPVQDFNALDLV
jgi:hypothetical protein